ncbi:MAG: hypothetical protein AAB227_01145 [Pseudomonadota bacterium]
MPDEKVSDTCQITVTSCLQQNTIGHYGPYANKGEAERHLSEKGWEMSARYDDAWEAVNDQGVILEAWIRRFSCSPRNQLPTNKKK